MTDLSALPSVSAAALPSEIRTAPKADQQAYRAALGFERILLGELVGGMTKAAGLAESPRAGAIEDAMSDALTANGGLGLGEQLFGAMRPQHAADAARTAATGPSSATGGAGGER